MQTTDRAGAEPPRSYLQEAVHDCVGLVWHDERSQARATVEDLATQFVTTAPLFIGGGRGFAATAALDALNQAKVGDTPEHQLEDISLGAAKGLMTKGAFEYIGKRNWNFAQKGVAMGVSFRTLEMGMSRDTYNINGQTNILGGLESTAGSAFNPTALVTDVAMYGLANYGLKFANAGRTMFGLPEFSLSPRAVNMLTGGTYGFTSGALGEVQRQSRDPKHQYDAGRILERGATSALTATLAAGAGYELTPRMVEPVVTNDASTPRLTPEAARQPFDLTTPEGRAKWINSAADPSVIGHRQSVAAGYEWFQQHPFARPHFGTFENDAFAANADGQSLEAAIDAAYSHNSFEDMRAAIQQIERVTGRTIIVPT